MEHWRKTSCMEPLPLGRRNDKRKLQVGDSSRNKKPLMFLPIVHVQQGDFKRLINDAANNLPCGETAPCILVDNKKSPKDIRKTVWSLQQGMTAEEARTKVNLGVGTSKHPELPQHGHPENRISENGSRKTELGWKKTQAQSSGQTTRRLHVHDQAECSHKNPPGDGNEHHTEGKARNRVMDMLHKFREYCDKLSDMKRDNLKRVDNPAAQMVKSEFGYSKQYLGQVPGVQVRDKFCYRMELHILGLHRPPRSGIDTMDHGGEKIAISVVASGGYDNRWKDPNTLIYCGHGGNYASGDQEQVEDQKLERGNRALLNSRRAKNPVRVIRGQEKMKVYDQFSTIYTYDGLYTVEDMWKTKDPLHHKIVFKFKLVKFSGQS